MHRSPDPQGTDVGVAAWARAALATTSGIPDVRRVGIAVVEGGGRRLHFTASDRGGSTAPAWCHIDAYDDVPLNAVVRSGEPVLGSLDRLAERYPRFVERQRGTGTLALAAVPIVSAGQVLGAVALFFGRPQEFDVDQRERLVAVGRDLGARLRRAERTEERPTVDFADDDLPPGTAVAVHEVPPGPSGVGSARRFLRDALRGWGVDGDAADTAVLCTSELVTNAVIHTTGGCGLRAHLDRGVLTVGVRDNGSGAAVTVEEEQDPLEVHGRGLQLVEALATRWGSTLHAEGATVWFVLDLDPGAAP